MSTSYVPSKSAFTCHSGFFNVNFEKISKLVLMLNFLTLSKLMPAGFTLRCVSAVWSELRPFRFRNLWLTFLTHFRSPLTVKHRKKKTKKKSITESEDTEFLDKQEETDSSVEYRHKYRPSLTKTLVKGFGLPFFLAALLKLIHDSLMFTGPWLLG